MTLFQDDELIHFEAHGAKPLPSPTEEGFVENRGATIWYATFGAGPVVILLHGGLGHSGNWGYQVSDLVMNGYRVLLIDSRGHGRSTRDDQPYTYHLMATDVLAVMDSLSLEKAALVGWSDGACVAMIVADKALERVTGIYFFGCNMDPSGTKEFEFTPTVGRCFNRHVKDYGLLSSTPDDFEAFSAAVGEMMKTEPNYTAGELAKIRVPVVIALSENDEFIKREHAEYLAKTIPHADLHILPGVSHFAPLQRPDLFNQEILAFLQKVAR